MDHKRAYLVLGAESSGTRLVTRLLVGAGCHGSDEHFDQPFDAGVPEDGPDLVVWRRSVPHDGEISSLGGMIHELRGVDYNVMAVVTVRDLYATSLSQVNARHVPNTEMAEAHVRIAYRHIFAALMAHLVPYVIVPYESLVLHGQQAIIRLYRHLGLGIPNAIEHIYDANEKYYV